MTADLLDRVRPAADDLMARVEEVLATQGAPADHPVWSAARRVGATPQAALAHFAALDGAPLRAAADHIRADAIDVEATTAALAALTPAGATGVDWAGAASHTYARAHDALGSYLEDVDDRLRATAAHADAVADWVSRSRDELAFSLARCMESRQAVSVRAGAGAGDGVEVATAAADLATHVLTAVADCVDEAWALRVDWQGRLDGVVWQGPRADVVARVDEIRLG